MTRAEVAELLTKITALYPGKFRVEDKKLTLDLWHDSLAHHEYEVINENLMAHARLSPFPPTVNDLGRDVFVPGKKPKEFVLDLTAGED